MRQADKPKTEICKCIHSLHGSTGCHNETSNHRFCGPCQAEGAIEAIELRRKPCISGCDAEIDRLTARVDELEQIAELNQDTYQRLQAYCAELHAAASAYRKHSFGFNHNDGREVICRPAVALDAALSSTTEGGR